MSSITQNLDGYWETEGYGYVFQIEDNKLFIYELTTISCFKIDSLGSVFKQFPIDINDFKDRLRLEVIDEDKLIFELIGTTIRYTATRIDDIPIQSQKLQSKTNDPIINFEIFWHTFNEHYAFLNERKVNWQALYEKNRPKIDSDTDENTLFQIMTKMLVKLKDIHVQVSTNDTSWLNFRILPRWANLNYISEALGQASDLKKHTKGKLAEIYENVAFRDFLPLIKNKYLKGKINRECNGMLFYGSLTSDIGYLYVSQESNYVYDSGDLSDPDEGSKILKSALDTIVDNLKEFKVVILDLRFNMGGNDLYTLAIVERFAQQKQWVFAKQARSGTDLSPIRKFYVEPNNKKTFPQKRVITLISGLTMSSGEIQAFAMSAFPNVRFVGEPTMGCLSDTLMRHLPNGWSFTLSNEIFYSHDMQVYEVVKFKPDIEIKMNLESFQNGIDNVLEKAIQIAEEDIKD